MYIRTSRLIIRDYVSTDWHDLHEIFSDPEAMRYCEPPYMPEQTKEALDCFIQKGIAYAVALADSGKVIGHALFAQLPPPEEQGTFEIAWFYNRSYWGQGYAYEASKALIDYGFQELRLHKILAETIDSVKSTSLMKKLSMTHEETLHAHVRDPQGNLADVYWYAIRNPKEKPE